MAPENPIYEPPGGLSWHSEVNARDDFLRLFRQRFCGFPSGRGAHLEGEGEKGE